MTIRLLPRLQYTALSSRDGRKMETVTRSQKVSGPLLPDLSKAFDCILHEILIAKLAAYGFDYNCLQILKSYLSNRKQRTKINDAYSKYFEILFGVQQGSISGSLLFNIYICDMFYDINDCDIASYADDNTPYVSSSNLDALITNQRKTLPTCFSGLQIIT